MRKKTKRANGFIKQKRKHALLGPWELYGVLVVSFRVEEGPHPPIDTRLWFENADILGFDFDGLATRNIWSFVKPRTCRRSAAFREDDGQFAIGKSVGSEVSRPLLPFGVRLEAIPDNPLDDDSHFGTTIFGNVYGNLADDNFPVAKFNLPG